MEGIRICIMSLSRGDDLLPQTYLTSIGSFGENVNNQCVNPWSPYFCKVPIGSGEEVIHISLSGLVMRGDVDKGKIAVNWEGRFDLVRTDT
jgi:hypothetical protein